MIPGVQRQSCGALASFVPLIEAGPLCEAIFCAFSQDRPSGSAVWLLPSLWPLFGIPVWLQNEWPAAPVFRSPPQRRPHSPSGFCPGCLHTRPLGRQLRRRAIRPLLGLYPHPTPLVACPRFFHADTLVLPSVLTQTP